MGRGPNNMLGTRAVAQELEVNIQSLHAYVDRGIIPAPAGRFAGRRVWTPEEVAATREILERLRLPRKRYRAGQRDQEQRKG